MEASARAASECATCNGLYEHVAALRDELLDLEHELADVLAEVGPAARESARNLVHYLALRRRDRRALQERLAHAGLASLGGCAGSVLHTIEAVLGVLARLEQRPVLASAAGVDRAGAGVELERRTALLLGEPPCARDPRHLVTGGPRPRTGAIGEPGQRVSWQPDRDELGRVLHPALVWLVPEGAPAAQAPGPALALSAEALAQLGPGQRLLLTDVRGKRRQLVTGDEVEGARACASAQTAYLIAGEPVELERAAGESLRLRARVLAPPAPERRLLLARGELLVLTRSGEPGRPARRVDMEQVLPACVPCSLPEVFAAARPGERLLLDQGKIGGIIETVTPDELHVRIVASAEPEAHLGADQRIHLPDTQLEHAAESFADLDVVVLEIDSRAGFEALPALLLATLGAPATGVKIARGDLAIECGHERLAELEEDILCLCEAAHVPVIGAAAAGERDGCALRPLHVSIDSVTRLVRGRAAAAPAAAARGTSALPAR